MLPASSNSLIVAPLPRFCGSVTIRGTICVIRAARLVPSPDAGLIQGAPQRSRRSKFNWREPSSDSVTRNTAKFLAVDASVRGLGNDRSSEGEDAHPTSRAPEYNGADAVRIPLGPAKWVRCMPVRRLRGLIHHLAERPKTLVFSAFSGRSSISEHLPVSSEPAWPRRSSRCPQAPPATVCTALCWLSPSHRNARGAWITRIDTSVHFPDRRRSCATCIESAALGCDAIDPSPRF